MLINTVKAQAYINRMIPRYGIRIQTVLAMRHISSMRGGCNGMLNTGDIEFMKELQDEIYELRCRPITFFYVTTEYDEESGIEIGETEIGRASCRERVG